MIIHILEITIRLILISMIEYYQKSRIYSQGVCHVIEKYFEGGGDVG